MHSTRPVATRLPTDEVFLVELEAERAGLTVSEWIRKTIRARLERERQIAPTRTTEPAR